MNIIIRLLFKYCQEYTIQLCFSREYHLLKVAGTLKVLLEFEDSAL